jgi:hypothetical protein
MAIEKKTKQRLHAAVILYRYTLQNNYLNASFIDFKDLYHK